MITTTKFLDKKLFEDKDKEINSRIVLKNVNIGGITSDQELTPFVSQFGTIRREIEYDKGLFRPPSHSFSLDNNLDISGGKELLSKRINFDGNTRSIGTQSWITKSYDLFAGVKGSPENAGAEDYVHLYTGVIDKRSHDQITNKITVSSQDESIRKLLQKKVCGKISASSVAMASPDFNFQVQQYIRYGIHRFPVSGVTAWQTNDIDFYGSCVPGIVNDTVYFRDNFPTVYDTCYAWYFPLYNETEIVTADYVDNTKMRIWIYDWVNEYWGYIYTTHFSNGDLTIFRTSYGNGYYVLVNPSITAFIFYHADNTTWHYMYMADLKTALLNKTTRIVTEVTSKKTLHSAAASCYPITVIHDLLNSSRFGNISSAEIDELSMNMGAADTTYTFDSLYAYYVTLGESDCFRLRIDKETTLQDILSEICRFAGVFLLSTGKNQASLGSVTADRHLKTAILRDFTATDLQYTRIYTMNGEATKFNTDERGEALYQKIKVGYLSSAVTTANRNEFYLQEMKQNLAVGDDSSLTMGDSFEAICLFWNAPLNAEAVAVAYKAKYCEPNDLVTLSIDCRGLIHSPSDYVGVYNPRTGELLVFQVYVWEYDTDGKRVNMIGYAVYSSYGMSTGYISADKWTEVGVAGSPIYTEIGVAGSPVYSEIGA